MNHTLIVVTAYTLVFLGVTGWAWWIMGVVEELIDESRDLYQLQLEMREAQDRVYETISDWWDEQHQPEVETTQFHVPTQPDMKQASKVGPLAQGRHRADLTLQKE